jgi:hypothetical protein
MPPPASSPARQCSRLPLQLPSLNPSRSAFQRAQTCREESSEPEAASTAPGWFPTPAEPLVHGGRTSPDPPPSSTGSLDSCSSTAGTSGPVPAAPSGSGSRSLCGPQATSAGSAQTRLVSFRKALARGNERKDTRLDKRPKSAKIERRRRKKVRCARTIAPCQACMGAVAVLSGSPVRFWECPALGAPDARGPPPSRESRSMLSRACLGRRGASRCGRAA